MIVLAMPPSTNAIWRNVMGKTLKSKDYRDWMRNALVTIACQKPTKVQGRFEIAFLFYAKDKRRLDLDNRLKAPLDALKAAGVIEDDYLCRKLTAEWSDDMFPGGKVEITVRPYEAVAS